MAAEADDRSAWQIDPEHSLVEFAVTYLGFTTVKGRFRRIRGVIHADDNDLAGLSVEVVIDAASLETREERRDSDLRSVDFLDVERHPTITFRSTGVEVIAEGRLWVHGDLTVRGTTGSVVLESELTGRWRNDQGAEVVGIAVRTAIDRRAFGLMWNQALKTGGVLVGEAVMIKIEVQAIRQDP